MKPLAALISLGCVKNLVDSETMVPQLVRSGYAMTEDPAEASIIVVNTCGFLQSAVEEAVQSILEAAKFRSAGSCECLVATGCVVQRYGKKLAELLPEVDLFLGTSHYHRLGDILAERQRGNGLRVWISTPRHLLGSDSPRIRATPPHTAYLKIAEGCNHSCSFCIIPHLRGRYRSRGISDLVAEAARLADEGVKEINLIDQDTTAYCTDQGGTARLVPLLDALEKVQGIEWIRLLYAYPDGVTDDLLDWMAQSRKTVPYLDVPIQHCSAGVLERMGRRTAEDPLSLIRRIRSKVPHISLRTSLMVGFPGETEEEFRELFEFLEVAQFDHAGVFAYSPEPGTAAARYSHPLESRIKEKRKRALLQRQRRISRRRLRRWVGKVLPVLVEGYHPETELLLGARLPTQAPEQDGMVLITRGTASPGELAMARITAAHDYDLEAELADPVIRPPGSAGSGLPGRELRPGKGTRKRFDR